MPRRLLLVVKGWAKSLIEFVKGVFWILAHPLHALSRVIQLLIGAFGVILRPRRIGSFLKESPYEPYKAMTTLAVSGAIGMIGTTLVGSEQGVAVSGILLTASGIAYLLWRSVEFFHGNESTADGIDGFILITELLPFFGGLAVITRLARTEALVSRVEGLAVKTHGTLSKTGRVASRGTSRTVSRGVGTTSKTARASSKTLRTTNAKSFSRVSHTTEAGKSVEKVVQPTVSVGEWASHWINTGDRLSKRLFDSVRDVGKRFRR